MPNTRSSATTPNHTPLFLIDPQSALAELPNTVHGDTTGATTNSPLGPTAPNRILASPHTINTNSPPSLPRNTSFRECVTQADLLAAMREQQSFMAHQQQLFLEERIATCNALREQHQFMADQQRQLMTLLISRPPPPQPTTSNSPHTTAPKVRMADPPLFDGTIKETDNFLSSLENIFDSQPTSFPSEESRIRYALTFFSGTASNWRKLLLREVSEGSFQLNSWKNFEKRLETLT